jgi:hypothetical protein
MNIDVIREEAPLPGLTTGDHVVLHPVGAYNITQSMQFITYRPAVVMIGLDGAVHVIRRRENLAYVQELEEVPEHLAQKHAPKKTRSLPIRHPERSKAKSKDQFDSAEKKPAELILRQAQDDGEVLNGRSHL